jgi:hypothetical protein
MSLFTTPESPVCIDRVSVVTHVKILYKNLKSLYIISSEGDGSESEERLVSEKKRVGRPSLFTKCDKFIIVNVYGMVLGRGCS